MPGRKGLVFTLWIRSSLVLLAWALVAPTRNSGSVAVSSQPDCHGSHFALRQAEPTAHLRAGMAADADLEEDALLACEDEEQGRVDVLNELRASCLIACSFRRAPSRQVISPSSILSHYPIRC